MGANTDPLGVYVSCARHEEGWGGGYPLVGQGMRRGGEEAQRLFAEAEGAYRRALEVVSREYDPQAWAERQHGLGRVLVEQGRKREGPEAEWLFTKAMEAYRQALEVRTREYMPNYW